MKLTSSTVINRFVTSLCVMVVAQAAVIYALSGIAGSWTRMIALIVSVAVWTPLVTRWG
jgi:hypothetical protein